MLKRIESQTEFRNKDINIQSGMRKLGLESLSHTILMSKSLNLLLRVILKAKKDRLTGKFRDKDMKNESGRPKLVCDSLSTF